MKQVYTIATRKKVFEAIDHLFNTGEFTPLNVKDQIDDIVAGELPLEDEAYNQVIANEIEYVIDEMRETGDYSTYLNEGLEEYNGKEITDKVVTTVVGIIKHSENGILIHGDELTDLIRDAFSQAIVID